MGSFSPDPYLYKCDSCSDMHPTPHREAERDKAFTRISDLPASDHPWIMVKYGELTIFANEDFAPYVLYPNGELRVIKYHLPHELRKL